MSPATKGWGKYNLSQRQFEVLQEYRRFVAEKCSKHFKIPVEQLEPNQATDKECHVKTFLVVVSCFQNIIDGSKYRWSLLYDQVTRTNGRLPPHQQ